jgi:hypothetical protein
MGVFMQESWVVSLLKGSCDSLYFGLTHYVLLLCRNVIQKKYSECELWVILYSLRHKESVWAQIKL